MIETISQFASPDARHTRAGALRARRGGFHYCKRDKRHNFTRRIQCAKGEA